MADEKNTLIEELVRREWDMFQQVNNEGGRADCQDNWGTFRIMRTAQYRPWPGELISRLNEEFRQAAAGGRNLMMEKYARMMASTAPAAYARMESVLPPLKDTCLELAEEIIRIHKKWMAEHAAKYPHLAAQGRPLYSDMDTEWETSSETYLRGELLTWSESMLEAYLEFAEECFVGGRNLVEEQDLETVRAYHYDSLEEAEEACGRSS